MKRKSSGLKMLGQSMGLILPRYNDIPSHIAITLKNRNLPFRIKLGGFWQHLGLFILLYIAITSARKGPSGLLSYLESPP